MTWEEFDKIDVRYRSPMHREITLFIAYDSKAIPFLSTIVISDDISVKCEGESTHDTRPMPDGMYCLTVDLLPSYSIYWR